MPSGRSGFPYKRGGVIGGRFEVVGRLGKGKFSIVYVVYDRTSRAVYALKTPAGGDIDAETARKALQREAQIWLALGEHPFILAARFAETIDGRLFLATDFVAPDEVGRARLHDHLAHAHGPLDADRSLAWAIQFCHGMEHANACGIFCHRDIKPDNIFITQDGMVKIGDFGLAVATEDAAKLQAEGMTSGEEDDPMSKPWGAVGYRAPELSLGGKHDRLTDIYAFGVVLWMMATGRAPFDLSYRGDAKAFAEETHKRQMAGDIPHVDSPFWAQIKRSLDPERERRYRDFSELRIELKDVLRRRTGQVPGVPGPDKAAALSLAEKGAGLACIGRFGEAIACYDDALKTDPEHAPCWFNKGVAFHGLGSAGKALDCYDKALALDAKYVEAWNNKALALVKLGRHAEAIECYDKAIAIDPKRAWVWSNKGNCLSGLGRYEEALDCYTKAVEADARFLPAWANKGIAEEKLGRSEDALTSYRKIIDLGPPETAIYAIRARQGLGRLAKTGPR